MHVRAFDPTALEPAYGARALRLFPWEDVATPPFGSAWGLLAPGETSTGHAHHEGEAFFLVAGCGTMRVDVESRSVAAGDVVYVPPFGDHALRNDGDGELRYLAVWWEDVAAARVAAAQRAAAPPARRLLVTATPPTVNGDLHIGHLAGPYVAADAFARYWRMRGREVAYVTGADDHQSYVVTAARRLGEAPETVADRFTERVRASLAAAGVRVDGFSRPRTSATQRAFVQTFFRRLRDGGHAVRRVTRSPWCPRCETYLFEAWVHGRCPHCGESSDGQACEACGRPNEGVDLFDARCTACGTPPVERELERWVLPLAPFAARVREHLASASVPAHLRALGETMLAAGLPDVALSCPTRWGVPVPDGDPPGQSLYVWFEMLPAYLAASAETLRPGGWEAAWKSPDSEVVQFFGMDNGWYHAVLFPALLAAWDPDARPAAHYVVNEFYELDGAKFSTSRGHAVWAGDFLRAESADRVRWFLLRDRPETARRSFTLERYRRTVATELVEPWTRWLAALERKVHAEHGGRAPSTGGYTPLQGDVYAALHDDLRHFERALDPERCSLAAAARVPEEIVRRGLALAAEGDWLAGVPALADRRRTAIALELMAAKALALVCAPILPRAATRLWTALGFAGAPTTWEPELAPLAAGQRIGALGAVLEAPAVERATSLDSAARPEEPVAHG